VVKGLLSMREEETEGAVTGADPVTILVVTRGAATPVGTVVDAENTPVNGAGAGAEPEVGRSFLTSKSGSFMRAVIRV
jgi:hypothetical protein